MPKNVESLKFILTQFEEIKKLYDLSEAEVYLMLDLLMIIKAIGHSPKLALKLMKVATTILEVTIEHWSSEEK